MNEPNQVSDGRVYAGDQVWPNIFEAVGFPPEEAARMLAAVDAEIDARRRQAVCSWPRRGKPSALAGPGTRPGAHARSQRWLPRRKTTDPQRGSNQNPQRGAAPPAPGGSCAPRRFRALARSDAGSPALPTRREGGGLSDRVGGVEAVGGCVCPRAKRSAAGGQRQSRPPLERWGRGSAPGDPAGVVSAPPRS